MFDRFEKSGFLHRSRDQCSRAAGFAQPTELRGFLERDEAIAKIKAGELSYSADEVVAPPLIPIYTEVGEVELMGPLGYSRELLLEKWMRDAKINEIGEGTSEIQRLVISRYVLDGYKPAMEKIPKWYNKSPPDF